MPTTKHYPTAEVYRIDVEADFIVCLRLSSDDDYIVVVGGRTDAEAERTAYFFAGIVDSFGVVPNGNADEWITVGPTRDVPRAVDATIIKALELVVEHAAERTDEPATV